MIEDLILLPFCIANHVLMTAHWMLSVAPIVVEAAVSPQVKHNVEVRERWRRRHGDELLFEVPSRAPRKGVRL